LRQRSLLSQQFGFALQSPAGWIARKVKIAEQENELGANDRSKTYRRRSLQSQIAGSLTSTSTSMGDFHAPPI
jgi:hypothetical protein